MKTIKFLNRMLDNGNTIEEALAIIKNFYGIKHRVDEERDLYVLNYDQIDSSKHKTHDIVKECRSLVLGIELVGDGNAIQFYVVSRAFDRFFNYGEERVPHKVDQLVACEKLDGSLVTVFHYGGEWLYRTKSVIMPVDSVNGLQVTWKDIIEEALGELNLLNTGAENFSHIFEITSPENRVVTRYKERTATLLSVRDNESGRYLPSNSVDDVARNNGWNRPEMYYFNTWELCLSMAKELRNLEEGFVMYNKKGVPVAKVKNPAYVAAHHLRGEGVLNPKRIVDLILMNETDEYLSIFPEDHSQMQPYLWGYGMVLADAKLLFTLHNHIEAQKEFALEIAHSPVAPILFRMRNKGLTAVEAFDTLTRNGKQAVIERFAKAFIE